MICFNRTGASSRHENDVPDEVLSQIAREIPRDKYKEFGLKLRPVDGDTHADSILAMYDKNYSEASLQLLKTWKHGTGIDNRDKLWHHLSDAGLLYHAEKFLCSSEEHSCNLCESES